MFIELILLENIIFSSHYLSVFENYSRRSESQTKETRSDFRSASDSGPFCTKTGYGTGTGIWSKIKTIQQISLDAARPIDQCSGDARERTRNFQSRAGQTPCSDDGVTESEYSVVKIPRRRYFPKLSGLKNGGMHPAQVQIAVVLFLSNP